jgi:dUTP pyrophosphatase
MRLNMRRSDGLIIPLPRRSTVLSAGYDLFTPVGKTIEPGEQVLINLGIVWDPEPWRLDFPTNTLVQLGGLFAKVFDRSGLALKKRFSTLAGVIDQDYRDDWGLVCRNDGKAQITFEKGDKVAQFVLLPFLVAEDLEDAAETRSGGFGSTGN